MAAVPERRSKLSLKRKRAVDVGSRDDELVSAFSDSVPRRVFEESATDHGSSPRIAQLTTRSPGEAQSTETNFSEAYPRSAGEIHSTETFSKTIQAKTQYAVLDKINNHASSYDSDRKVPQLPDLPPWFGLKEAKKEAPLLKPEFIKVGDVSVEWHPLPTYCHLCLVRSKHKRTVELRKQSITSTEKGDPENCDIETNCGRDVKDTARNSNPIVIQTEPPLKSPPPFRSGTSGKDPPAELIKEFDPEKEALRKNSEPIAKFQSQTSDPQSTTKTKHGNHTYNLHSPLFSSKRSQNQNGNDINSNRPSFSNPSKKLPDTSNFKSKPSDSGRATNLMPELVTRHKGHFQQLFGSKSGASQKTKFISVLGKGHNEQISQNNKQTETQSTRSDQRSINFPPTTFPDTSIAKSRNQKMQPDIPIDKSEDAKKISSQTHFKKSPSKFADSFKKAHDLPKNDSGGSEKISLPVNSKKSQSRFEDVLKKSPDVTLSCIDSQITSGSGKFTRNVDLVENQTPSFPEIIIIDSDEDEEVIPELPKLPDTSSSTNSKRKLPVNLRETDRKGVKKLKLSVSKANTSGSPATSLTLELATGCSGQVQQLFGSKTGTPFQTKPVGSLEKNPQLSKVAETKPNFYTSPRINQCNKHFTPSSSSGKAREHSHPGTINTAFGNVRQSNFPSSVKPLFNKQAKTPGTEVSKNISQDEQKRVQTNTLKDFSEYSVHNNVLPKGSTSKSSATDNTAFGNVRQSNFPSSVKPLFKKQAKTPGTEVSKNISQDEQKRVQTNTLKDFSEYSVHNKVLPKGSTSKSSAIEIPKSKQASFGFGNQTGVPSTSYYIFPSGFQTARTIRTNQDAHPERGVETNLVGSPNRDINSSTHKDKSHSSTMGTDRGTTNNPIRDPVLNRDSEASDVIRSCPLCQWQFPEGWTQLETDGHIAECLSANYEYINWK